ncbi:MAG: membrane protein insertion efficiency factor YidD [Bradymonadia bacterium]
MTALCVWFIRGYQNFISPLLPPSCRFVPSCSEYAIEAYQKHGFFGGSRRTCSRICRCHPWSPGGYDPVDEP